MATNSVTSFLNYDDKRGIIVSAIQKGAYKTISQASLRLVL